MRRVALVHWTENNDRQSLFLLWFAKSGQLAQKAKGFSDNEGYYQGLGILKVFGCHQIRFRMDG